MQLSLILCFLACFAISPDLSHANPPKKILVLHSYHIGFKWTDYIQHGIADELKTLTDVKLYIEYMDSKRNDANVILENLIALFQSKYGSGFFDAVIVTDDNALDFILRFRNELFKDVPIVFCGINNYSQNRFSAESNITGVIESVDFLSSARLIFDLFPKTRHIAVISDVTSTGRLHQKVFEEQALDFLSKRANVIPLYGLTAMQLKDALQKLPSDSVVFTLSFWNDPTGASFDHKQSNTLIVESASAPVFTAWDHTLAHGFLGGIVISGYRQGSVAAGIVKRILAGEAAGKIEVISKSPHEPMFDFAALKRFGVKVSNLPENSIVLNEPISIIYRFRFVIAIVALSFFLLVFVIIFLSVYIFARKKAQRKLEKSEQRFRSLLEFSPLPISVFDKDGKILFLNDQFTQLFGYNKEQVPTIDHWWPLAYPDPVYRQRAIEDWKQAREQVALNGVQLQQPFQNKVTCSDGHQRHISFKLRLVEDLSLTIMTDLTDQIYSELRLRALSEASFDAVFLFEGEMCLDQNETAEKMFGYLRDQAIGKHFTDLFVPKHRSFALQSLVEDDQHPFELTALKSDGNTFPCEIRSREIKYLNKLVRFVSIRNIRDREQAATALKNSEERFKSLVDMLPEAIFETDQHLKLTFANQRAFELFGYAQSDIDRAINAFDILDPEQHDRVKLNFAKRQSGENPGTLEYTAIKKDGTRFPVLFHANSIVKDGLIIGLRGVIIDMTEHKKIELERINVADQLRQTQKMESIGRLAGGVSHDLNNLLSPIIGFGELLMQDLDDSDFHREYINQILNAGFRARDLVRQLLAFSRKQTLEYKPANLNHIVTGFEKFLRRTIREDIQIEFRLTDANPVIMADIGQIEQVIMNLSVNSQDAMPAGGKLILETSVCFLDHLYANLHQGTKPGHYAMLSITDTGCGMNEHVRQNIFEPFFSTKGEKGTGLGLATVYGIVKQHRGNIWVYSEPDCGSVFKIYLPLTEKVKPIELSPSRQQTISKGTETILVVEDNDQVRSMAKSVLESNGYKVITAEDGEMALSELSRNHNSIDLILTDVIMPKMNGKELYARACEIYPDIKVLFMSGYTDDAVFDNGVLENGVQFIQKPFTMHNLSSKIRKIIDRPK